MKIGVLFSGGKDSLLAAYLASKYEKISCLITIISENQDIAQVVVLSILLIWWIGEDY